VAQKKVEEMVIKLVRYIAGLNRWHRAGWDADLAGENLHHGHPNIGGTRRLNGNQAGEEFCMPSTDIGGTRAGWDAADPSW
jgi:hypothetical protein